MSVLDVQVTTTGIVPNTSGVGVGLTQQLPVQIYISTNDPLATVLTTGYLNQAVTYFQYPFNNYQMALVETTDIGPTWCRVLKTVNGSGIGFTYSLEELGAPGTVNLPTVANQIAYAVNVGGTLAGLGLSTALFNAGNISAGKSGTAGQLLSYPLTATTGSLALKAVANSGNYANVISNASTAQATTWSIPDPGVSTTTFLLADSSSGQTINTGNLTIVGNLIVDGVLSESGFAVGVGSAAAPTYTFTGRTNTGMYSSAVNTLDFTTDGTRQLEVGGAIVAVNYLQIQGSVASSPVLVNALGTDSNISIKLAPKGTGAVLNAVGAQATPSYSFTGRSDTGMFSSAAATLDFTSTGGENLQIVDSGGTTANYATITGSITTTPVLLGVAGSDTNISLQVVPKGTGGLTLATGTFTASTGNITSTLGSVSAGTTVTAGTGITATTGNIVATTGNITATAGNVTAGSSGHAGVVTSFPTTATQGSLILAAVSNSSGNFNTTISNASAVAQSQVVSVPDSGATTANFILSKSGGTQHITSGALQVDAGTISSGISTGGTAGGFIAYPVTTGNGSLRLTPVGNSGNFAASISNISSLGQASVYTLPDPGVAATTFLVADSAGTQTIATGSLALTAGSVTATAGNLQAGSSGHAGIVTSFPSSASNGKLVLAAASNAGNHTTTISNATTLGQDEVMTIPDVGASTGQFLVKTAALVSGNLVQASGTAGLTVDSGVAASNVMSLAAVNTMAAASQIILDKATGTESSNAVTINKQAGVITTTSLTTAGGATETITLTNSEVATSSVVLASIGNGTNNATNAYTVTTTITGSHTVVFVITNLTAATALNGTLVIQFAVF